MTTKHEAARLADALARHADIDYDGAFAQAAALLRQWPDAAAQEPVALQHVAVAEDGVLRWMSGRKLQECELYAMPDGGNAPALYAAPPPGWMPIESAPKDGTEIIMSNGKAVSAGSWFNGSDGTYDSDGAPNCDERDAGWMDWGGGMLPEPTHWMPLPPPPGAEQPEVEKLVRQIHQAIKRGGDTQDHGLIGNLRCILDHVLPDPPADATPVSGSTHGLSQDYNRELGKWFADRPGARQQLREDMAQAEQPAQPAPAPVSWERLRLLMDNIPTREEFIGGQRQKYVAKEAVMGWLYEGQLRAEREAAQPAGMVLVPLEPTPEMIEAGRDVKRGRLLRSIETVRKGGDPDEWMGETAGDEYRAMIAAAPAQPAVEPLTDGQFADMVAEASLEADLAANPFKLLKFARAIVRGITQGEQQ